MITTKLHSYGVIPLRDGLFGVELLLIDQRDRLEPGQEYWTFPKGTPEEGEIGIQTAVRETREETGILCDVLDGQFEYNQTYTFQDEGIAFEKTVTYFLGASSSGGVVEIQPSEVKDHTWLPLEEARNKLTHEGAREIIDAIIAHLPNSRLFSKS